jgi:hypothetical protein
MTVGRSGHDDVSQSKAVPAPVWYGRDLPLDAASQSTP